VAPFEHTPHHPERTFYHSTEQNAHRLFGCRPIVGAAVADPEIASAALAAVTLLPGSYAVFCCLS
jgi:hypothetical protein